MLLDVEELNPYLQFAFDHFASTLDSPFDFVRASFTNSPIPLDFGGNILKLAINVMEVRPYWGAAEIFSDLSQMVASCIMLDSTRHKIRGTIPCLSFSFPFFASGNINDTARFRYADESPFDFVDLLKGHYI